jgi:hypothetical protein
MRIRRKMRRNSVEIGALVVLNERGSQFFYGKALTGYRSGGIYKDVTEHQRKGVIIDMRNDCDNVKVAWNTVAVEYVYTWLSSRLLRKVE